MKTAIIYYSQHHGNTKKLIDSIASKHEIAMIDIAKNPDLSLSDYDIIGFASGIYFGKFHKSIIQCISQKLPENKKVFFIYTYGSKSDNYIKSAEKAAIAKNSKIAGSFHCNGFDTFGPFKLIGGIAKGHPNENEISEAIKFFENVIK